jgi:hypothetical protein
MRNLVVRNGLIGGGFLAAFMWISFPLMGTDFDLDVGQIVGYTSMTIAFGFGIVLGTH